MHLSWYTLQIGFATSLATPPPALASERLMTKWDSTGQFWRLDKPETVYWGTISFVPGVGTKLEWFEPPYNICYKPDNIDKCLLSFKENQLVADFKFKGEKVRLESFCARPIPSQINPDGKNWLYSHHLVIRPESKQSLDWLLDLTSSVRDIFIFLIGGGVYTLDVVGLSDRSENRQTQIFHVNLPVTVPRVVRYDSKYFLTRHHDYHDEIPELIKTWFERQDDLSVVIGTYRELLTSDGASHTTILFRTVQPLEHLIWIAVAGRFTLR